MKGLHDRWIAPLALGAAVLVAVSATAGYWFASRGIHPEQTAQTATSSRSTGSITTGDANAGAGRDRKPLYWYDPMRPNQHFDRPGKSPFMDMQLVPRFANDTSGEAGVKIDSGILQNLGVRLTTVERGPLAQSVEALGSIALNQRDVAVVQARTGGFVTRVYARAPGDVISRDAPLADLLVPDWAAAQSEFLAVLGTGERDLVAAARQRLLLLGMPEKLIASIEESRQPRATVTIRAPLAGLVAALEVREGMTVVAGTTLATINGLATVWLEAALPEVEAAFAPLNEAVAVHLTAYPGEAFKGRVITVLPQTNVETRTLRVRIELPNLDRRLKPGMFAQVRFESADETPRLYVASEAVIHTGTRTVVIVAGEHGHFIPTEVQVAADSQGKTIVLEGLAAGQQVVASGQFLIDSEASLEGVLARLGGRATPVSDR